MTEFQEKLTKLRGYYADEESLNTLATKEKELRTLIVSQNLRDNDVIKQIIEATRKIIASIDMLLQEDGDMEEKTRVRLFTEKKVHKFHLERLGGTETDRKIEAIDRFLDDQLAEIGESA